MNTNTTISITEARKKIFDIAREVQKPSKYFTLTENGRPKAVILGADEFESWQETLEVMRDFPNLAEDIKQAREEFKKGNYITLEELLEKEGYKTSKKNAIPITTNKKGSKKAS